MHREKSSSIETNQHTKKQIDKQNIDRKRQNREVDGKHTEIYYNTGRHRQREWKGNKCCHKISKKNKILSNLK